MIEKIILAIAITFSLSWSLQTKPQQRVVAVGVDLPLQTASQLQVVTLVTV